MKLTQLTEGPTIQELEQHVQALVSRYEQLFSDHVITEQTDHKLMHVVQDLKQHLLKIQDTSYQGIDYLMREISHAHDVDVDQLHDAFVDAEGVTPDEWTHAHKSQS